jgi:ethanolamine utilization protein EutP (predicted NTPase)
VKPHLLVLNKKDLSDLQMKSEVEAVLKKDGIHHIFFTNCKDSKCPGVKQVGSRGNRLKKLLDTEVFEDGCLLGC